MTVSLATNGRVGIAAEGRAVKVGIPCTAQQVRAADRGFLGQYVAAIRAAGGEPKLLVRPEAPPKQFPDIVPGLLDQVDALVLPGGGDVDPSEYGEPRRYTENCDPIRDKFELALARHVLTTGMPVFGVCRGLQLLTVAAGGTLIQDIPRETRRPPEWQIQHQQRNLASLGGNDQVPVHMIQVKEEVEGTGRQPVLKEIFGMNFLPMNSAHHEAAKEVGEIFAAVAVSCYDGIIEAIERKDNPRQWALQGHPERLRMVDPIWTRVFERVVADGREWRGVEEAPVDGSAGLPDLDHLPQQVEPKGTRRRKAGRGKGAEDRVESQVDPAFQRLITQMYGRCMEDEPLEEPAPSRRRKGSHR